MNTDKYANQNHVPPLSLGTKLITNHCCLMLSSLLLCKMHTVDNEMVTVCVDSSSPSHAPGVCPSPRSNGDHSNGDTNNPRVFQELRVPRNGDPHVGVSPVFVKKFDRSPYQKKSYGETWDDYDSSREDYHKNNGIFALQEKINLLKNHPSEMFNFMVVSGSPRLGNIL